MPGDSSSRSVDEAVLSLMPVNGGDDALHAIIAATALASGLATPAVPPPTLATEPGLG